MINPKHPLQYYNTQQEFFLKHLADQNKEYHMLYISYSNAVYLYYDLQLNISENHYEEWLNGIEDEQVKSAMQSEGFKNCLKNDSFVQFIKEKRKVTEKDYIMQKMGHKEYSRYQVLSQNH
ncbi:hypothetical protein [Chryseobacterium hagamense]|uniref:Uncharacterized protein n=1 Tax=Chryseobacterium hagamense TaxID=395935 RepID=A0A511YRT9_9FLAO|nr:hypothetical protein [Chryseobacterium hagamense]GEN77907.1 hypothetical protein CHA01nite_36470 [Chryseobacterium hagamense]